MSTDLFEPAGVKKAGVFSNSTELLKAMADDLQQRGYVSAEYATAVIEREAKYPTGLPTQPLAVAIPHADPNAVLKAGANFWVLDAPVAFGEMGSQDRTVECGVVVMLALTDGKSHLNVLNSLIGLFSNAEAMNQILAAEQAEDVHRILGEYLAE